MLADKRSYNIELHHGDVKAVISYYPYIGEFDQIEEMKDIKKFVIGQDVEGWNRLDEEMLTALR